MKIKVIILAFIMLTFLCITGCSDKKTIKNWNYDANIIEFNYSYGSYDGGSYIYEIKVDNDVVNFNANGYNGVELNKKQVIDKSNIQKLEKIIKDNDIGKWNGFNKEKDYILDGYSFNLIIKYSNGYVIEAYGYEKYPKNYKDIHNQIIDVLENI